MSSEDEIATPTTGKGRKDQLKARKGKGARNKRNAKEIAKRLKRKLAKLQCVTWSNFSALHHAERHMGRKPV